MADTSVDLSAGGVNVDSGIRDGGRIHADGVGSVLRARYGLEFSPGPGSSFGDAHARPGTTMDTPVDSVSFDASSDDLRTTERMDRRQNMRISNLNPLYHTRGMAEASVSGDGLVRSTPRAGEVVVKRRQSSQSAISQPRVVEDLKQEVQTMRDMQRQQEKQRDDLLGLLAQEREKNDARNSKTLGLLQKKDGVIDELSRQCDDASDRIAELENLLEEERENLLKAERRIEELVDLSVGLRDELKKHEEETQLMVEAHQKEVHDLEEMCMRKNMDLDVEKESRKELESNMEDVAQAMDAAEEIMRDMEQRFENDVAILNKRCVILEHFIANKLGIDACEHVRHLPSLSQTTRELNSMTETNERDEDDKLLKANKALEEALIRHAIKTKRIDMFIDGKNEEVAIPSFIRDEHGMKEETVETLKADVEHLSKAHQMAQQVALHAESELMAALDRESDLKEQLKQIQASRGDSEKEESWRNDALDKIVDLEEICQDLETQLSASKAEVKRLESSLNDALRGQDEAEKIMKDSKTEMNRKFVGMHNEIQSLRAQVYTAQRKLSTREAKIASLSAVQKFSLDLTGWESIDIQNVDPISSPIEFLVRSLQEAAQMQTELLESLSEVSYVKDHGQEALAALEKDMERVLEVLRSQEKDISEFKLETGTDFAESIRTSQLSEIEILRSQVERAVAIQHGQAEAYSMLISKCREKESSLKSSLQNSEAELRGYRELYENLETAAAAMTSSLAKVALVESGEELAKEILSRPCGSHQDILEVSILVADKLGEIAQVMSGGTVSSLKNEATAKKLKYLEEKYSAVVSAYEAAKMEAKQATTAYNHLKSTLATSAHMSSPAGSQTPASVLTDSNQLLNLVNKFEEVLEESNKQEDRIRELEAERGKVRQSNWATLVSKKCMLEQVRDVWNQCKDEIKSLKTTNSSNLQTISDLNAKLVAAEASLESSLRKQSLMKDRFNEDMSRLKSIYDEQILILRKSAEEGNLSAHRDDDIEDRLQRAALETEERCIFEYTESMKTMENEINNLERRCRDLEEEKKAILEDFKKFQQVKNASIALLEKQLNIEHKTDKQPSHVQRKDALSLIEDACNSDAAHAALQQAKYERSERERIQQELDMLIQAHHALQQEMENVPPKRTSTHYRKALEQTEARIEELDRQLEENKSEELRKQWHDEAAMLENNIASLALHRSA